MSTIVTRAGKGSPLTHNEVDANFNNLNNDKYQSGDSPTFVTVNSTTVDTTNLEVTNVKAKDGTAALSIADSTGKVTVSTELAVDNINVSGNAITSTNTNGNIDLTPNGTGEVNITKVDIDSGTIDGTTIGGSSAAAGTFTSLTNSGNLTFSSTGQRITGDMSNATLANRLAFQTSTTNGNTIVGAFPNGTGTNTRLQLFSASDPANASTASMEANATSSLVIINADKTGTGTYLPMTFYTGGSERMRLDTTGRFGVGTNNPAVTLQATNTSGEVFRLTNTTAIERLHFYTRNAAGTSRVESQNSDLQLFAADSNALTLGTSNAERMRIDSSGNVGIGGTANAFDRVTVTGTLPTSGNTSIGIGSRGTIPSGTTSQAASYSSVPATQAASFTLGELVHYWALQGTFGAGSTVTNQFGFRVDSSLTGATNNFGFHSNIAAAANRWNFYAAGTANNYFAGNTGVGSTDVSITRLRVTGAGATSATYATYMDTSGGAQLFSVRNDGAFFTGTHTNSPYNLTTASAANCFINADGALYRSTSSLRYKSDVADAAHGLADVLKLRSVTYKAKNDGDTVFGGLIAEEVHDAGLTEFVTYDKEGRPDALHYGNMVALLVKAVQELKAELEALKAV